MSDLSTQIMSSMRRGAAERRKTEAAEEKSKKAAQAKDSKAIERQFNKFVRTELKKKCRAAAKAGEDNVVVHKIDNADLEAGYDGYNPKENGSDIAFGLLGAARHAVQKLRELRLQPDILWGGEIDFETYGEAYYVVIPVQTDVEN